MIEVTCECGWQTRGTEEEVIASVQEHGRTEHDTNLTREQVLAIAKELS
ncbi:MAG: DUF1059 domain-containing protein [Actinomycetota bacterium]